MNTIPKPLSNVIHGIQHLVSLSSISKIALAMIIVLFLVVVEGLCKLIQ